MMSNNFEMIEVSVRDIAVANGQDFLALDYRRAVPVVLLCRIPSLKHTSLIRCSPLDTYFCAVRDYPAFSAALHAYTSTYLIPSDSFYDAFLKEMRKAGINRQLVPRALFSQYTHCSAYGQRMSAPLGGKFSSFAFDGRVASAFVPDDAVDDVIRYWDHQFEQFGPCALRPAPEALNDIVGHHLFDLMPRRSLVKYECHDYDAVATHVFTDGQLEEQALWRLTQLVNSLERGESVALDLFPFHAIKLTPSVFLKVGHAYPSFAWKRAQLRARLIRLLGYVWHYPSVMSMVETLAEKPLRSGDERDAVLDQILSDLGEYLADMRRRYPVIEENPFTNFATV